MSSGEENLWNPIPTAVFAGIFIAIIMLFAFIFVGDGLNMLNETKTVFEATKPWK